MAKAIFEFPEGIEEYEFESRIQIKLDTNIQRALLRAKSKYLVKCSCLSVPNQAHLVIFDLTSKNCQSLRRNHKYEHAATCLFYDSSKEFYNDKQDRFTPAIFKEPKDLKNKTKDYEIYDKHEIARRNTYKHFCIDVFSGAISYTFNSVNKTHEGNNPIMYKRLDYFSFLQTVIKKKEMVDGRSPFDVLPKNSFLSFGIIEENLNDVIDNELTLHEYNHRAKEFWKKKVEISDQRLKITQNVQKIYGKVLEGPYAYIAVYREDSQRKRTIIRLYTYAIQEYEGKFCFVESSLERDYAKKPLSQKIAFIKPISGSEHKTIGKKYYKKGHLDLRYRPDFIEFHENGVEVVEVCGFPKDHAYMKELKRKEVYYHKLEQQGLITYRRE